MSVNVFVLLIIFLFKNVKLSSPCPCGVHLCCLESCFCWINQDVVKNKISFFKYTFLKSGEFSHGACNWCSTRGDDSNNEKKKNVTRVKNFYFTSGYPVGPLFEEFTWCPSNPSGICNTGFHGSYDDCCQACKDVTTKKKPGLFPHGYQVQYVPSGEFSHGVCACKGEADPCVIEHG